MELRHDAPLLGAYLDVLAGGGTPFTIPGHKRRAGHLDQGLQTVVGGDVPLYAGLDTMRLAHGVLADAQGRAAGLWGGDWCGFSTGGSTHGNQAMCLALGRDPGDEVLVARTLHRSTLLGLVLADLAPVWLPTTIAADSGLPLGVDASAVEAALTEHPRARGVLLTEPGYLGALSDVSAIAGLAHRHGVPLVVDQAWGAHLGFHPALPPHALQAGADALVTSMHKALPAYTQAALVVARTELLPAGRLQAGFDATATTSPAGSILASIDACRALLAADGETLLGRLLETVGEARDRLRKAVPELALPDATWFPPGRFDPSKLVLQLAATGADGLEVENDLIAVGLPVEMADRDTLAVMITLVDGREEIERLTDAVAASVLRRRGPGRPVRVAVPWRIRPQQALTPRAAFFGTARSVRTDDAAGEVSAEIVAIYPPGIPVLAPGEVITAELLDALHQALREGSRVAYATDPTLATLRVVT